MSTMMIKILVSLGSILTIGFGAWHFFVPRLWQWYSYISPQAAELVQAVRAINVFFSLCLVLIGIVNLIFLLTKQNRFVLLVMLALSCILWATRCLMQVVYPQGSINPALQYGMLAVFLLVFACFLVSFLAVLVKKA